MQQTVVQYKLALSATIMAARIVLDMLKHFAFAAEEISIVLHVFKGCFESRISIYIILNTFIIITLEMEKTSVGARHARRSVAGAKTALVSSR